jgi:hypothetical protein
MGEGRVVSACDYCGHPVYPPDEMGQDDHVMCIQSRVQQQHPNEDWAAIESDMADEWQAVLDGKLDKVSQVYT